MRLKTKIKRRINRLIALALNALVILSVVSFYSPIKTTIKTHTEIFNPVFDWIDPYYYEWNKDYAREEEAEEVFYPPIATEIETTLDDGTTYIDYGEPTNVYYRVSDAKFEVTLSRPVDGDTARFYLNDGTEIIARFLLLDTPETKHPTVGVQPFGPEASDYTSMLLNSASKIELEYDIGQQKDHYDRHLVYIWVDEMLLQDLIIKQGLGEVAYVSPPNTRYLDVLETSQTQAKQNKLGIWSLN